MNNAIDILHKIEHFISNCDNYIVGRWTIGNVEEVALLQVSYFCTFYYLVGTPTRLSISMNIILAFRRNKEEC